MKSDWVTKKLGEVCAFRRGLTYSKGDEVEHSSKVVLRANNITLETNQLCFDELKYIRDDFEIPDDKYLEKDCLLICTASGSKTHLGKVAYVEKDYGFAFGGFMGLIVPNDSLVFPRYFYYALTSENYRQFIGRLTDGANINNLKFSQLAEFDIPIPPLAEQKRIVAKIDAAFEKIDKLKANAEKNLANAKELFQSALDEAMRPKKGWVEKRLGEVCSKIGSGATPRGGKASYCSKGISLIRSMNVYDCAFEYSELAHINDIQAKELANVTIEANDVLINITGASVARCCVVPSDVIPARVNQHVAILRIADDRFLNPDFLCYTLVAPSKKSLLLGIGEAGSTRQALTKTDLTSFKIFIPDIFEQKRIVERVKALAQANETLQQNYARQVADCAEMRQAILREAFEGRL